MIETPDAPYSESKQRQADTEVPDTLRLQCSHCRTWQPPDALLQVEHLATRTRRWVCKQRPGSMCFRAGVGPSTVDRIIPSKEWNL